MDLLRKSGEFPVSNEELDESSNDGLRRNLRRKRFAWCEPAGERSARSPAIWELGYRRWFAGSVGAGIGTLSTPAMAAASDVTAELKRLRRENEILRQERDILKKATAFFAREGSR